MPKTKQEAADFLGVSTRAIESYAARGRLSVTYTKGRRGQIAVFDDTELEKLKDELTQPTFPERPQVISSEQPRNEAIVPFGASALIPTQSNDPRGILSEYRRFVPVADKPLLKLQEAQALTGLSRHILKSAVEAGALKAQLIGRSWRIKRTDLDSYIANL